MNAALLLLAAQLPAQAVQEDAVLVWNEALLQAIRVDRTPPPKASRNLAILHVAMYDTVNALKRTHTPFLVSAYAPAGTDAECAAAIAAHCVLHSLYPNQRRRFDAILDRTMHAHPDGEGKEDAVALGKLVADRVLGWRENDGSSRTLRYYAGSAPGDWQPTPPDYRPPLLPQWGRVKPFAITSLDAFRPTRPPVLNSAEYTANYREVKALGGVDSRARTRDQTEIAHFWAGGEGTVTPPGLWNRIAQTVSRKRGLYLEENARLFALLNMAMADAAIACWECKYRFSVWRPIQAIREARRAGNPDLEADPNWQPLLTTPPFPSYTSGHSSFSGAAAAVLACYIGSDQLRFTATSEDLPGVRRSYHGFWAAALEAGKSRIYGGIHYEFDNAQGLAAGRAVGNFICRSHLRPRRELDRVGSVGNPSWWPQPVAATSSARPASDAAFPAQ